MIPLLFAFLALPCLSQGSSKGLNQLIKEEDKFHLLTEVCLDQIYQREEYKFYSGTFCLNQTNFYFPYKAYQLFSQQNIPWKKHLIQISAKKFSLVNCDVFVYLSDIGAFIFWSLSLW